MFNNYFKTAFRNLLKFKAFSLINIVGLAIGISVFLVISLFVKDELGYDTFHEKAEQIHRIGMHAKFGETDVKVAYGPALMPNALKQEFPEVIETTRLKRDLKHVYKGTEIFSEENFYYADSTFFDVFTVNLLQGNSRTALNRPNCVILTKETANKYFGTVSAIGNTIRTTDGFELEVTGIAEKMPSNSLFEFDFLASIYTHRGSLNEAWVNNFAQTYFLLDRNVPWKQLEGKLPAFVERNVPNVMGTPYQAFVAAGNKFEFFIQPLLDIHFTSGIYNEFKDAGDITILYYMSAIGLFILLIACINFINLSTARSTKRANEIGVRKVLGSSRGQLVYQFLAETILLTFLSVILALVIVEIFSPLFSSMADKDLAINYVSNWYVIPLLGMFTVVVGFIAGIYPALFITSFNPVQALKGKVFKSTKGMGIRRGLVVFQFVVSIILTIATTVVLTQMEFMRDKDLGYKADQTLVIRNATSLTDQLESFKGKIRNYSGISGVASSNSLQNHDLNLFVFNKDDGTADQFTPVLFIVDDHFFETYQFEFIEGRPFSSLQAADTTGIVISETSAKILGYDNPMERKLITASNDGDREYLNIIGIVKDFHMQAMHEQIRPAAFALSRDNDLHFLSIKLRTENIFETVDFIKSEWSKFAPDQPMDYTFFDESFAAMYEAEIRASKLFSSFASLAIIIACLGLFGLIAYAAEQRTKEIGIRKVMGSSVIGIVLLLSKEFALWISIANIIAWPLAYYFMDKWLQNFAYRTDIELWVFMAAAVMIFFIAFATVGYQSIKAATANPVKSLRYE